MKKWITIGIILVVLFIIYRMFGGTYNNMVTMNEEVTKSWQNVESAYQRRFDLIPNLVNTVQGYAEHEKSTLTEVIEARNKVEAFKIEGSKLSPDNLKQYQQVQDQLSASLNRLMIDFTVERYPDLKANTAFLDLQTQLERTENRINVERNKFNQSVKDYNAYILKFPQNLLANTFGFEKRVYFSSDEEASKAPEVKFN